MKKELIIIPIFVLTIVLVMLIPNNDYIKTGKLYVSEIMASNNYTIKDDDGDYSDYIEIYNGYKNSINLSNYHLSDDEYDTKKWTFPDITIKSNENIIVYASGKNKCDLETRICHTNFKLSKSGEIITLTDSNGNIINKFSYGNIASDISYGYIKNKYIYMQIPTPGKENNSKSVNYNKKYNIVINEYMTHNKGIYYNEDGYSYDYIELYNNSKKDVILDNIYLSDNINKLNKYKIPKTQLKAESYLLIFLTKDKIDNTTNIYANFALSEEDEYIILSDGKNIIDKVEIVKLPDNVSYGKYQDKYYYFTKPTPGYINNTAKFSTLGGDNGST